MNRFRTPLGGMALAIMVFGTVFAAASALTVTSDKLPQSGSVVTAACDTDGVNVGYTVSGGNVTEITVSDDDCTTGTISISTTPNYVFDEGTTQNNSVAVAGVVTYTLTTPVAIGSFDPGTVNVTLVPNP